MAKIITSHFTTAGIPQPGLSPVIDIFLLNALNPLLSTQVVTAGACVEIGSGWYRYDFIAYNPTMSYVFSIDGGVSMQACDRFKYGGNESYVEDISSGVWDEPATDHAGSGSTGFLLNKVSADTTSLIASEVIITALLNTLLKYERNRTKIDTVNAQLIIYDDDCITPLTTFDLRDFSGMPSVQEVCERVPQGC